MNTHYCLPANGGEGIARALANARPGDQVLLAPGRYLLSRPLEVTTGVVLRGQHTRLRTPDSRSSAEMLATAGQLAPEFDHPDTAVLVGNGFIDPIVNVVGDQVCLAGLALLAEAVSGAQSGDAMLSAIDVQGTRILACRFGGGGQYCSAVELIRCCNPTVSDCAVSDLDPIDRPGRAAVVLKSVTHAGNGRSSRSV